MRRPASPPDRFVAALTPTRLKLPWGHACNDPGPRAERRNETTRIASRTSPRKLRQALSLSTRHHTGTMSADLEALPQLHSAENSAPASEAAVVDPTAKIADSQNVAPGVEPIDPAEEKRLVRKVDWIVLPVLLFVVGASSASGPRRMVRKRMPNLIANLPGQLCICFDDLRLAVLRQGSQRECCSLWTAERPRPHDHACESGDGQDPRLDHPILHGVLGLLVRALSSQQRLLRDAELIFRDFSAGVTLSPSSRSRFSCSESPSPRR